jgi:hypothetical protein
MFRDKPDWAETTVVVSVDVAEPVVAIDGDWPAFSSNPKGGHADRDTHSIGINLDDPCVGVKWMWVLQLTKCFISCNPARLTATGTRRTRPPTGCGSPTCSSPMDEGCAPAASRRAGLPG